MFRDAMVIVLVLFMVMMVVTVLVLVVALVTGMVMAWMRFLNRHHTSIFQTTEALACHRHW